MKALFFDTSFIFGQGKKGDSFLRKFREEGFSIFIPELVVEESKAKNRREIRELLRGVEKASNRAEIRKSFPEIYVPKKEQYLKAYKKSDENTQDFFDGLGTILPLPAPADAWNLLLARDQEKKPPFVDGDSDKGWKDTLIWTSILEFSKSNEFEEYIFVTKDHYDNGIPAMQKEFKEVTGKDIAFLKPNDYQDLTRKLGLGIVDKKDDITELVSEAPSLGKEEVEQCKEAIRSFVYWENEDGYIRPFFKPDGYVSGEQICSLCDYLLSAKDDYLFAEYVDIGECFAAVGVRGRTMRNLWAPDFYAFIDCWETLSAYHPEYRDVFARQVARELNR